MNLAGEVGEARASACRQGRSLWQPCSFFNQWAPPSAVSIDDSEHCHTLCATNTTQSDSLHAARDRQAEGILSNWQHGEVQAAVMGALSLATAAAC